MSEDEEELDRQDDFEAKYNFRFQEEGANDVRFRLNSFLVFRSHSVFSFKYLAVP